MRNLGKVVMALTLTVGAFGHASASGKGTSGAQFLRIGAGARGPAMGGAFGPVADDASAIYWNPAGMAMVEKRMAEISYNAYFKDSASQFLGYAHPMGERGTIGLSGTLFGVKDIEKRSAASDTDTPDSTFKTGDMAVSLGWANKREMGSGRLDFGMAVKYISSDLETKKAATGAVDLGVTHHFSSDLMGLSASLAVQNLGGSLKFDKESDPLPLNIKPGMAWKHDMGRGGKLTMVLDSDILVHDGIAFVEPGFEWWAHPMFALRGGYQFGRDKDAGAGFGVGAGFRLGGIGIDYAFVPYGNLGDTHRISLGLKF